MPGTENTRQTINALIKQIRLQLIPSSSRCENVKPSQFSFSRPHGPQLEKEIQASSPLSTAFTLGRLEETSCDL